MKLTYNNQNTIARKNNCQIQGYINNLNDVEKAISMGNLASAFNLVASIRGQISAEISMVYALTGNLREIDKFLDLVGRCDSLKRKILRIMARTL